MGQIVVVGGGQAAASLVARLRTLGVDDAITLIGEEPAPPYQRPPLSKAYLLGEIPRERLFLRPEAFYSDHGITLRTGDRVTRIDRAQRRLHLASGDSVGYDSLVLATGAVPRRLPAAIGGDLPGVFTVRTLADVDSLAREMRPDRRALIVGGGYIGLEAAAVARKLGLQVTLLEAAPRLLARVACAETADFFRDLHRRHAVDIREGVAAARLTGTERVTGAILDNGTEIAADLVIVGVGVVPAIELAEGAGLAVENGIAVDARGRTSDPAIWAAGDCTSFPCNGRRLRLESVQNAVDQAECVATNLAGAAQDYVPAPWFWSDQYDVKLQIAGLNIGHDRVIVRPGPRPGSVSHWYFAGDRLLSVDAMNDPRAYMTGKRLIDSGASPALDAVADTSLDLRALSAAAA